MVSGLGPGRGWRGRALPLPHPADAAIDPTIGWFAARKGAVQYVEPTTSRCPAEVDLENLGAMVPAERLDCFGGRTIEFDGTYSYGCPTCEYFGRYEPAWLASPNVWNRVAETGTGAGFLNVRFPPGLEHPEDGSIIRVKGHFDDPLSADCSITLVPWDYRVMVPHVVPGSIASLWCRQMFVVESYDVLGPDTSSAPNSGNRAVSGAVPARLALRARDLALELGEVAADVREGEGLEDRLLRFSRQQEFDAAPDEVLGRVAARREALEVGAGQGDGVAGLAPVVIDRHRQSQPSVAVTQLTSMSATV